MGVSGVDVVVLLTFKVAILAIRPVTSTVSVGLRRRLLFTLEGGAFSEYTLPDRVLLRSNIRDVRVTFSLLRMNSACFAH